MPEPVCRQTADATVVSRQVSRGRGGKSRRGARSLGPVQQVARSRRSNVVYTSITHELPETLRGSEAGAEVKTEGDASEDVKEEADTGGGGGTNTTEQITQEIEQNVTQNIDIEYIK